MTDMLRVPMMVMIIISVHTPEANMAAKYSLRAARTALWAKIGRPPAMNFTSANSDMPSRAAKSSAIVDCIRLGGTRGSFAQPAAPAELLLAEG